VVERAGDDQPHRADYGGSDGIDPAWHDDYCARTMFAAVAAGRCLLGRHHAIRHRQSAKQDPVSQPDRDQREHAAYSAKLTSFIAAKTITQAMLTDPNEVLRAQVQHQKTTETIVIFISTNPAAPMFAAVAGRLDTDHAAAAHAVHRWWHRQHRVPAGWWHAAGSAECASRPNGCGVLDRDRGNDVHVPPMPFGTPPVVLEPVFDQSGDSVAAQFVAAIPIVPARGCGRDRQDGNDSNSIFAEGVAEL